MKNWILICGMLLAASSFAKLPELSAEAKAKADEAKAKAAWSDKISAFQLCKAQDKVAAHYLKAKAKAGALPGAVSGAVSGAAVPIPACVDPGPYVVAAPPSVALAPNAAPVVANVSSSASKK